MLQLTYGIFWLTASPNVSQNDALSVVLQTVKQFQFHTHNVF